MLQTASRLGGDVVEDLSFELGGKLLREAECAHLSRGYLDEANGIGRLLFALLTGGGATDEKPCTEEYKANALYGLGRNHYRYLMLMVWMEWAVT